VANGGPTGGAPPPKPVIRPPEPPNVPNPSGTKPATGAEGFPGGGCTKTYYRPVGCEFGPLFRGGRRLKNRHGGRFPGAGAPKGERRNP